MDVSLSSHLIVINKKCLIIVVHPITASNSNPLRLKLIKLSHHDGIQGCLVVSALEIYGNESKSILIIFHFASFRTSWLGWLK